MLCSIGLSAALLGVFVLAGCGGGGSSSPATRNARLFITDNLNEDYDQVWVNIMQVSAVTPTGKTTVFSDSKGKWIDVASLRDSGGNRFAFLTAGAMPVDTTALEFTLDSRLILFPTGSGVGTNATFADPTPESTKVVNVPLSGTISSDGNDDIVVDFDLSQWTEEAGVVTPVIVQHNEEGLEDPSRHEDEDYAGAIANLSGSIGNLTFDLVQGPFTARVKTTAETVVYNESGASSPTLANGRQVEVYGKFDVATGFLTATKIKVDDEEEVDPDEAEAEGEIIDIGSSYFKIRVSGTYGFMPTKDWVQVNYSDTTVFTSSGGITLTKEEFVALLAVGKIAEAEGTYDESTNILTARKAKMETDDEDEPTGETEVSGPISNLDAELKTFSITVNGWEGAQVALGTVLSVVVSEDTIYKSDEGAIITESEFFEAVSNGSLVEAEGVINSTTLPARKLKLDND